MRKCAIWVILPTTDRRGRRIAEEATAKLGQPVTVDLRRPFQAYDAGGRARAAAGVVQAIAQAKEAGIDPDNALKLVGWGDE